jgi:hypothetical protein
MPRTNAKSKCQENAAAVANFRHIGAAKHFAAKHLGAAKRDDATWRMREGQ